MRKLLCSGLTAWLISFSLGVEALGETGKFEAPPVFLPPPLSDCQVQTELTTQNTASSEQFQGNVGHDLVTVFTPFENGTDAYIDYLEKHCRKNLYVADYTFTSQAIADEYCKLAQNGVAVHVILDLSQTRSVSSEQPLIDKLRAAGVEVIITTSPYKHAIMHCKFSVADEAWVQDGSWNYTTAADKQCNYLNFTAVPSPQRASAFLNAWRKISDYAMSQLASKRSPGEMQ